MACAALSQSAAWAGSVEIEGMRTSANSRSRLLSKSFVGGGEDGVEVGHGSFSQANSAMMRAQLRMPL